MNVDGPILSAERAKVHTVELTYYEVKEAIRRAVEAPRDAAVYLTRYPDKESGACVTWRTDVRDIRAELMAERAGVEL